MTIMVLIDSTKEVQNEPDSNIKNKLIDVLTSSMREKEKEEDIRKRLKKLSPEIQDFLYHNLERIVCEKRDEMNV